MTADSRLRSVLHPRLGRRGPAALRRPSWALPVYAWGVGLGGVLVALVVLRLVPQVPVSHSHLATVGALALCLIAGELTAVPVRRGEGPTSFVTLSTSFAVALIVVGPIWAALLAQVVASVLDDLRGRKRPIQVVFNAGQYLISVMLARGVFSLAAGVPFASSTDEFRLAALLPTLAAGFAFSLVNDGMVGIVAGLASGSSVATMMVDDVKFKLQTSGVLVAMAPLALVLVFTSPLMLPLVALPVVAVRRAFKVAALHEHQSLHDPLTGLANRALFRRRVDDALEVHGEGTVAVLMVDLDHFKDVNDTLGHDVGDELLIQVAGLIDQVARRHGADVEVARLGGDEFAVLLVDAEPTRVASRLGEQVLAALDEPIRLRETRVSVQASVGITTGAGAPLETVANALRQADIALYEAKLDRARAVVFHPGSQAATTDRLKMVPDLRDSISQGLVVPAFQPQVDAVSAAVVAVEALARWQHPERGLLPPSTFIEVAESSGLVGALTDSMMRASLLELSGWRAEHPGLSVAVNLSPRLIADHALPDRVADALAAACLPGEALTVEVTENSLIPDPRAARSILGAIREMGVRLSIDDFGTGYSSLRLLQELEVDELKIDRSFVIGLTPSSPSDYLVRSIVDLGHHLGLCVVAEGVEDARTATLLRQRGCDRLQGYLYARPELAVGVPGLLRAPTVTVPTARSAGRSVHRP